MLKKVSNTIELYTICTLPILFSIGRFIPFVETLLTALFFVMLIISQAFRKRNLIKYVIIAVLFVVSTMIGHAGSEQIEHIKPLVIFFLSFDAINSELFQRSVYHIKKYRKIIEIELFFVIAVNTIFSFLPSLGYSQEYSDKWSLSAFRGVYADPHQCAYHICALLIILLWLGRIEFKKTHYWILALSEYCIMITGARAPSILGLFLGIIFVIDHFVAPTSTKDMRNKVIKVCLTICGIVGVGFLVFKFTSMGYKITNSFLAGNFDNGRAKLIERDISLFKQSDIIHKLFGYGVDNVIKYHGSFKYSRQIWSHNDFLQILTGMGLLMLIVYVLYWCKRILVAKRESVLSIVLVVILVFIAYINGLYLHTRLVFLLPLLFMYFSNRRRKNKRNVRT